MSLELSPLVRLWFSAGSIRGTFVRSRRIPCESIRLVCVDWIAKCVHGANRTTAGDARKLMGSRSTGAVDLLLVRNRGELMIVPIAPIFRALS